MDIFLKNIPIWSFMKIPPVGTKLYLADRQTERQTYMARLIRGFLQFYKSAVIIMLRRIITFCKFSLLWRCDPTRLMASSFLMFLDHTQRRSTVGRTPLDEWSARHRDLYLTTHSTHNRKISIPPVGFEPTISAGERPQTQALDRVANGTGVPFVI